MHASKVIDLILVLAILGAKGVVNIGSGVGRTVQELAMAVAQELGRNLIVRSLGHDSRDALIADTRRLRAYLCDYIVEE
jgi:F0F1-type ATP synthase beta subunit